MEFPFIISFSTLQIKMKLKRKLYYDMKNILRNIWDLFTLRKSEWFYLTLICIYIIATISREKLQK